MKAIRPLIRCGCTGDEVSRCVFRSPMSSRCLCPCHYSDDDVHRLLGALMSGAPSIEGWIKNRLKMEAVKKTAPSEPDVLVNHSCGHEKRLTKKPSPMAAQYIQQNPCDECRR